MSEKITRKEKRFIRKNFPGLSVIQIAQRLKASPELVERTIKDLGLEIKPAKPSSIDRFFSRYATLMTAIVACAYILFFSILSILRYRAFDYYDFDFAIFAQVTWNILHGSIQSSILGVPFLGDHLHLILFLVAPLYKVFPTPLTLLLLQTLLLGLGVIPIYLLTKDNLDKGFAFLFSLLYLIYPALHFVNMYEFHPVAFVTLFLLWMFYYFQKKNYHLFILFMSLSLLCKENISAAITFFGLYVLFFTERSWKWWTTPLVVGGFYFLWALKAIPYFNKDILGITHIYSQLGGSMPEVIGNIIDNPSIVLRYLFADVNMKFLFHLFFPLAFLSLFSPKILFIAIPFFLQQLLSSRVADHTIYYHYTAKFIPFLFIAAIYGTRFVLKIKFLKGYKWFLMAILLISSIGANSYFGFLPQLAARFSSNYVKQDIDYLKQDFVDGIPKEASVVSTFEFLPKLSQRKGLYSFHHVYTGRYTLSTKEYDLPEDVEYALIDFDDYLTFTSFYMPDYYKNLQKFLEGDRWNLVAAVDNIALFKKEHRTEARLFFSLREFSPSPANFQVANLQVGEDIVMTGYEIKDKRVRPGQASGLSLIWECKKERGRDYWLSFKIVDKKGEVLHSYNHPICYRIYPTYVWKKGDILREELWIYVPSKVKTKEVYLKMSIFWREMTSPERGSEEGELIKSNVSGIFDQEGWINLGKIEIESSEKVQK